MGQLFTPALALAKAISVLAVGLPILYINLDPNSITVPEALYGHIVSKN